MSQKAWQSGNLHFARVEVRGRELVKVMAVEGDGYRFVTSFSRQDMAKRELNYDMNYDVEKYKRIYL